MPKEYINNKYEDPNSSQFIAEVRWSRDKYCQVATVKSDTAADVGTDGYFVDLDRDGINRMIRVLRKARDQAFGADA